jgi:hypothetical protein
MARKATKKEQKELERELAEQRHCSIFGTRRVIRAVNPERNNA